MFTAAGKKIETKFQNLKLKALPTGTIVASMLELERFQKIAGNAWKPADGRKVSAKSKYATLTGNTTLPDLRGMFLRGLNQFDPVKGPRRDKYKDPDGSRRKAGKPKKTLPVCPRTRKTLLKEMHCLRVITPTSTSRQEEKREEPVLMLGLLQKQVIPVRLVTTLIPS